MTYRLIAIAAVALLTSGCSSDQAPMWRGSDISAPLSGLPPSPDYGQPVWHPPPPARAPPVHRPFGSGSPPDPNRSLDAQRQTPPALLAPPISPPSYATPSPSPLDLPGYQRTGPIANGPGGTYNSVGSTIFGPGGKVCTPVGASLTCL